MIHRSKLKPRKKRRFIHPVKVFFADRFNRRLSHYPATSPRDYVQLLLKIANKAALTPKEWFALNGGVELEGFDGPLMKFSAAKVARLNQHLATIKKDPAAARRAAGDLMRHVSGRILAIPGFEAIGGKPHLTYRIISGDGDAGIEYALICLITEFGGDLCKCELPGCDRDPYFLAIKPQRGRPQRKYCCQEHRDQRFNAEAGDRVRAWRGEMSIGEFRKQKKETKE